MSATTHTLGLRDLGARLRCGNPDGTSIVLPANADVPIPVRSAFEIWRVAGGGVVTFDPAMGVTLNDVDGGSAQLDTEGTAARLVKIGEDEWDLEYTAVPGGGGGTFIGGISASFDGGGSVIPAGKAFVIHANVACTITAAIMLADQTGSIVIDVQKTSYASYDGSFASICASAKPTISSAKKSQDGTLTGWTVSLAAGDVLRFVVDSCSAITWVHLQLTTTRTLT